MTNYKKLFVIDAMAMAFRTFHAFGQRPLTTANGLPTSAVYGSASFILRLIEQEQPDYLVIASDTKAPTFRHELYPEYKANRSEMPEDLAVQIPYLYRLFATMNIPTIKVEGVEADDLIGSMVRQFARPDLRSYIVSGDKDFMQLIDDQTFLYSPQKGGQTRLVDKNGVLTRFGCQPTQIIDVLALIGDSSDNVPGVRGIGEKGAAKLIQSYDNLSGVYANIETISNKRQKEALSNNRQMAELSRQLVTIKTDLELSIKLEDCVFDVSQSWVNPELRQLFEDLEFKTLTQKVADALKNERHPAASSPGESHKVIASASPIETTYQSDYRLVNSPQALQSMLEIVSSVDILSFDTETTGLDIISDNVIGVSIAIAAGKAFYLPTTAEHLVDGLTVSEVVNSLRQILQQPQQLKVAHNLKFDMQMLKGLGVDVTKPYADSMLASYLIDPAVKTHGLDACVSRYLGHTMIPITELIGPKKDKPMTEVPLPELTNYACEDADYTLQLYKILISILDELELSAVFWEIEMPLVSVLAKMELIGVHLDTEGLARFSKELETTLASLTSEIHQLADETFNINSTKQLQRILFEKLRVHEELGIKRLKKTKTGFSTDSSVLEQLSQHPLAAALCKYRAMSKLKNTYVDNLPNLVKPTTLRLHTHYHQTGTATGRLSSSDPNLQNIPIRTELGKKIRLAFSPAETDFVIISADYSQVELRLLAHLADEPELITAFASGADIHTATAAKVFSVPESEVDATLRSRAKAINFGIIYGMGPQRLARETSVSIRDAKEFIERYFETYPKIRDYIETNIAFAREHGFTKTLYGRRRPLPEINSNERMTQVNAENIAVNSPVQGSAADLIKIAMIHIDEKLPDISQNARMLLQVHDELVFECPADDVAKVSKFVKDEMENAMKLKTPLLVEVGSGRNWLEAH